MKPKTPRSEGELRKRIRSEARETGQPERRIAVALSFAAIGATFENAKRSGLITGYAIKGGASLALRYAPEVRTTADFDVELIRPNDDLEALLARALSPGLEAFQFFIKEARLTEHGTLRAQVAVTYKDKPWNTVPIDVRAADDGVIVDRVPIAILARFDMASPADVTCLSVPSQIAQKLHAMTAPRPDGRQNERSHDLIDILKLSIDAMDRREETLQECVRVFALRDTHGWPPVEPVPATWNTRLIAAAAEAGLPQDAPTLINRYWDFLAFILGIKTMTNFQYHFLVLSARPTVPNALESAIDTSGIAYETFKRMTEAEGWRVAQMMEYPGMLKTRAILVVLERELPKPT